MNQFCGNHLQAVIQLSMVFCAGTFYYTDNTDVARITLGGNISLELLRYFTSLKLDSVKKTQGTIA